VNSYIRLNITTEGSTELRFVKDVLFKYLQPYGIYCDHRSVLTSKEYRQRGGMTTYAKAKKDIQQWINAENSNDRRFTTMFDFYALPTDFPGYSDAQKCTNPYEKVKYIENAFAKDINDNRFIPYIQLHEFEALLFSDLDILLLEYEGRGNEVKILKNTLSQPPYNNNPELINEKRETSPSYRIMMQIPEYQKITSGSLLTDLISIDVLRTRCKHFDEWLTKLENLTTIKNKYSKNK
jgi:hypothetical protein